MQLYNNHNLNQKRTHMLLIYLLTNWDAKHHELGMHSFLSTYHKRFMETFDKPWLCTNTKLTAKRPTMITLEWTKSNRPTYHKIKYNKVGAHSEDHVSYIISAVLFYMKYNIYHWTGVIIFCIYWSLLFVCVISKCV